MENSNGYYHLFANGDDARNFVISDSDFIYQLNLVGITAFKSKAKVVSFSIEDSHPHFLLFGTEKQCCSFKTMYKMSTIRHIASTRGDCDGVILEFEMYPVESEDYLMKVASYVCVQPTKDGKQIMQYDYLWGSGSMYFRSKNHVPIWQYGEDGAVRDTVRFGDMKYREKKALLGGRLTIPDDWLICNGIILPDNYVDVDRFERIFRTHNCFRVFSSAGLNRMQDVVEKMAQVRGVRLEDIEARRICSSLCHDMFGVRTVRHLDVDQRVKLASCLRSTHRLSVRQISTLTRIPEMELLKYFK